MATTEEMLVKITADLSDLQKDMKSATDAVNGFADKTTKANKKVEDSFKSAATALKAFVSIAAINQGFNVLFDAIQKLDDLGDTAEKIGITAERLQELQYAADRGGSSAEVMTAALRKFNVQVGNAKNGSGELKNVLDQYNISLKNTDGTLKSNTQLFDEYVNLLGQTADISTRAAMEVAAFGKSGADLDGLFRGGLAAVNEYADAARRLGLVLSNDVVAQAGEAGNKLKDLKDVIKMQFTAAIAENATVIGQWADTAREGFGTVVEHADQIKAALILIASLQAAAWGAKAVGALANFIKIILTLNTAIKAQVGLQAALLALQGPKGWAQLAGGAVAFTGTMIALNKVLGDTNVQLHAVDEQGKAAWLAGHNAAIQKLQQQLQSGVIDLKKFQEEAQKLHNAGVNAGFLGGSAGPSGGASTPGPSPEQTTRADAIRESQRTINQIYADSKKEADDLLAAGALSESDHTLRLKVLGEERVSALKAISDKASKTREEALKKQTEHAEKEQEIAEFQSQAVADKMAETKELQEQERKYADDLEMRYLELVDPAAAFELQLQKELAAYRELDYEVEELAAIEKKRRDDYAAGNASLTEQLLTNWADVNTQMDLATSSWLNSSANMLTDFVTNGKADFKDFAKSVIKDITAIIIKLLIAKAIGSAFSSMFGGGAGQYEINGLDPALVGLGKAGGGSVSPGQVYPVGERGPELFVPSGPGKIVPNGQLGGSGGSVRVEIVNRGTPQQATSQSTTFDPKGMVIQVITEDMRRNGPISAGMSQLYGLRRQA